MGAVSEPASPSRDWAQETKSLRARLISGELDDHCRSCPSRGWTEPSTLVSKLTRYLATGVG